MAEVDLSIILAIYLYNRKKKIDKLRSASIFVVILVETKKKKKMHRNCLNRLRFMLCPKFQRKIN